MQTRWWLCGYDEPAIFQPIKLFFHLSSHPWVEQTLHIHNLFKRHSPKESISAHISYADSWSLNSNAGNFLYKSDACDKLIWQTLWVTNAYNCHRLEKDLINGVLFQVQLQEPSCLCLPCPAEFVPALAINGHQEAERCMSATLRHLIGNSRDACPGEERKRI